MLVLYIMPDERDHFLYHKKRSKKPCSNSYKHQDAENILQERGCAVHGRVARWKSSWFNSVLWIGIVLMPIRILFSIFICRSRSGSESYPNFYPCCKNFFFCFLRRSANLVFYNIQRGKRIKFVWIRHSLEEERNRDNFAWREKRHFGEKNLSQNIW